MRALLPLALVAGLLAAAEAPAAGGVYASSRSQDAAACARACTEDGLCMAWSFQADGACELRATMPAEQTGVAYGVSRRAPVLRAHDPVDVAALEPITAPAPISAPAETAISPTIEAAADDDMTAQLLGGLDEDATGLRP